VLIRVRLLLLPLRLQLLLVVHHCSESCHSIDHVLLQEALLFFFLRPLRSQLSRMLRHNT
jgi:hypothetical protein